MHLCNIMRKSGFWGFGFWVLFVFKLEYTAAEQSKQTTRTVMLPQTKELFYPGDFFACLYLGQVLTWGFKKCKQIKKKKILKQSLCYWWCYQSLLHSRGQKTSVEWSHYDPGAEREMRRRAKEKREREKRKLGRDTRAVYKLLALQGVESLQEQD